MHLIASQEPQKFPLLLGLDALGNDIQIEPVREGDDAGHYRHIIRVLCHCHDERAIYLQRIDRQARKVAQRRISRPKVINRHAHAHLPNPLQLLDDLVGLLHHDPFRNLDIEQGGAFAVGTHGLFQHRDKVGMS